MRRDCLRVGLLLAGCICVASACAKEESQDWFERTRLGMSVAEVQELLPTMEIFGGEEARAYPVRAYFAADQTFDQLPGCRVELRFFEDRLWVMVVHYGDHPTAEVQRILEERYGAPSRQAGPSTYWTDEGVEVMLQSNSRSFSLAELTISAEVIQAWKDGLGVAGGPGDREESPERRAAGPE